MPPVRLGVSPFDEVESDVARWFLWVDHLVLPSASRYIGTDMSVT